jgi:hypothetical protein
MKMQQVSNAKFKLDFNTHSHSQNFGTATKKTIKT